MKIKQQRMPTAPRCRRRAHRSGAAEPGALGAGGPAAIRLYPPPSWRPTVKELELTLRVRNNCLKERREALGMNQAALAVAARVSLTRYRELECLRRTPRLRGDGPWREIALQLARFHCVEPEDLFPPAVLGVGQPVAVRKMNAADIYPLLTTHQERLLEGPDGAHDRAELREQVDRALAGLRPRDADVLRLRFGLEDGEEHTLEQIGAAFDLTRDRIRQLEARALRTLRRSRLAGPLRVYHEEVRTCFDIVQVVGMDAEAFLNDSAVNRRDG